MGGSCICCHYFLCNEALELHHLDPKEKEHTISQLTSHCTAWSKIVDELRKCVLICCLCHREFHNDFRALPESYAIFDERYSDYDQRVKIEETRSCKYCGTGFVVPIYSKRKYCSVKCACLKSRKIRRPSKEELAEMLSKYTKVCIADMHGVSDKAIRKWALAYGLI
jgi:hypothetical protein